MILAGDIGGTNTRLALVEQKADGRFVIAVEEKFPSKKYDGLGRIVEKFLAGREQQPAAACFGVAGPVHEGRCATMNLTWVVDQRELAQETSIPNVTVINDLEANAYGISCLQPEDIEIINPGAEGASGHACVVSPGTGLGEAGMFWDGSRYIPIPTEGGHTDFGPRNPLEMELATFLMRNHQHLSYERIVSGPGLVNIFEFLRESGRASAPASLLEEMQATDPAAVISQAALQGKYPICEQALDIFLEIFGAEAGNVALTFMAKGGVWLGGGIVVKILPRVKGTDCFMKGFTHKGRLIELMERIPVRVILNDKTALLGAAFYGGQQIL
jgi:glucokinase